MARRKKIAILTGGGDVPGLNSCIKQVVGRALENDYDVIGVRRGWEGLLCYEPGDDDMNNLRIWPLTWADVRTIDRSGGTFLHTARVNPAKVRESDMPPQLKREGMTYPADMTERILANLKDLEVEALIPIGGDDTLSYAAHLNKTGFPLIAIPKTMDNDVYGTDYCIGFSTAVTRSVEAITQLRTPVGSHERIGVIELFGRNSGETALVASYLASVDRSLISEVPFDMQRLADLLVMDKHRNPSNYAICTISEGATMTGGDVFESGEEDAYGHKNLGGVGQRVAEHLQEMTDEGVTYQALGYMMRCGAPDALDRMVAMNFGNLAMDMLIDGASGLMVALREGKYATVGLNSVVGGVKRVEVDRFYDVQEYRSRIENLLDLPMFLR